MNVLIVYAHHEPTSFTSAMKNLATQVLSAQGHSVAISDLYGQGFNPVAQKWDFVTTSGKHFNYMFEQKHAARLDMAFSPDIVGEIQKIQAADLIIFATPIWWGGRSSLMQRVIERLDALDEEYISSGRSALLNKVAGIVITGSEDGAQATLGSIMEVLTFMNFTLPPECATYWIGEVGQPGKENREKRLKNESTNNMAQNMARNLVYYAKLLSLYPL